MVKKKKKKEKKKKKKKRGNWSLTQPLSVVVTVIIHKKYLKRILNPVHGGVGLWLWEKKAMYQAVVGATSATDEQVRSNYFYVKVIF